MTYYTVIEKIKDHQRNVAKSIFTSRLLNFEETMCLRKNSNPIKDILNFDTFERSHDWDYSKGNLYDLMHSYKEKLDNHNIFALIDASGDDISSKNPSESKIKIRLYFDKKDELKLRLIL